MRTTLGAEAPLCAKGMASIIIGYLVLFGGLVLSNLVFDQVGNNPSLVGMRYMVLISLGTALIVGGLYAMLLGGLRNARNGPRTPKRHRVSGRPLARPVSTFSAAAASLYRDQRGNIQVAMTSIIFGVLVLVVGLILSDLVIDQVGKAAASLGEPTYSDVEHDSAGSINALLVILYYIVLISLAVGMIGGGAVGAYRSTRGGM